MEEENAVKSSKHKNETSEDEEGENEAKSVPISEGKDESEGNGIKESETDDEGWVFDTSDEDLEEEESGSPDSQTSPKSLSSSQILKGDWRTMLRFPDDAVDENGKLDPSKAPPIPLLIFVNKKSGGQQGVALLEKLVQLFHPKQIFDLGAGGPREGLETFQRFPTSRILVCGGDGTVGWVLSVLDELNFPVSPPVGILPLGTGNDLARSLNWGGGYTGGKLGPLMAAMVDAEIISLDRWQVNIFDSKKKKKLKAKKEENKTDKDKEKDKEKEKEEEKEDKDKEVKKDKEEEKVKKEEKEEKDQTEEKRRERLGTSPGKLESKEKKDKKEKKVKKDRKGSQSSQDPPSRVLVMNNYLSLGVDAQVALGFHESREASPEQFKSRSMNKVRYTLLGLSQTFKSYPLHRFVRLSIDDHFIDFPKSLEGIIVLNLGSYMGGTDLWGPGHSQTDGVVEVVGVRSSAHLGAIKVGLASAIRLGQGSHVTLQLEQTLAVQIDGEPWEQEGPVVIEVNRWRSQRVLVKRKSGKDAWRAVDPSLLGKDRLGPEGLLLPTTPHPLSQSLGAPSQQKRNQALTSQESLQPVVMLVEPSAGASQGTEILPILKELLHPDQVGNLAEISPEQFLEEFFLKFPAAEPRIFVAGGNRTLGRVAAAIVALKSQGKFKTRDPPMGVLPLGLFNDLSRALLWGDGYEGTPLVPILLGIPKAVPTPIDRWTVTLTPSGNSRKPEQLPSLLSFGCLGNEADAILRFRERPLPPHQLSRSWPHLRRVLGMDSSQPLEGLEIQLDGIPKELPSDLLTILFLNTPSYMGVSVSQKSISPSDGFVDIVLISRRFGKKVRKYLGKAQEVTLKFKGELSLSIDGHAQKISAGSLTFASPSPVTFLRRSVQ